MKHAIFAALAVLLAVPAAATAKKPAASASHADKAKAVVTALSKSDFTGATRDFDATMKKALPADKLKAVWAQLEAQVGKYKGIGGTRSEKVPSFDVVYVLTKFEKADLETKVVFDTKSQVGGLFFVPKAK